jgi:hypothetical protein
LLVLMLVSGVDVYRYIHAQYMCESCYSGRYKKCTTYVSSILFNFIGYVSKVVDEIKPKVHEIGI